jgi:hypothetical protein
MNIPDSEIRIMKNMHNRGETISYIRRFTRRGHETIKKVLAMEWPKREKESNRECISLSEHYYLGEIDFIDFVKHIQEVL